MVRCMVGTSHVFVVFYHTHDKQDEKSFENVVPRWLFPRWLLLSLANEDSRPEPY